MKFHVIELRAKLGEVHVGGARCVLVRDFLLPVWRIGGESDTKFSLLAQNASKMGISGVLGEFCTGWARRGGVLGGFCTDTGPACGTKFSLLGLVVGVSAKKFSQRTKNAPKMAFYGLPGELFRGSAAGGAVLGELFRGSAQEGGLPGEVFRE